MSFFVGHAALIEEMPNRGRTSRDLTLSGKLLGNLGKADVSPLLNQTRTEQNRV